MPDDDALDERLRAVERALTDDDADLADLRDAAALTRQVDSLADRLGEVEERLDELDAATQALRGYVGNVRAVNDDVERRADAALAAVERLEADLDATGTRDAIDGVETPAAPSRDRPCGCATHSRASAPRSSGRDPTSERDADAESGDERLGVLARLGATLAGLWSALTGSR